MFTVKYFTANLSSILSHFSSKLHAFVISLRVSLHTENAQASVRIIKGNET